MGNFVLATDLHLVVKMKTMPMTAPILMPMPIPIAMPILKDEVDSVDTD